jgi:hypothetical protein
MIVRIMAYRTAISSFKEEPMNIDTLPSSASADELNPLVFSSLNDVEDNPRLGLGYHQLYDPTVPVPLIARLPEICREGDIMTLFWDGLQAQQYPLDQATIEKGWLSFSVLPKDISGTGDKGSTYYTLYDPVAGQTRTSSTRTIKVNRLVPGGLDPDTLTAINENLALATVSPQIINSADTVVTVSIPMWLNMALGDELTVIWNGIRASFAGLTTIAQQVVPIPKDVLERGGSNAKLPVSYEIRDIVDNYSLPSANTFANVDIDPTAIAAPRVQEADQITLILDLAALGDNDAHVLIPHYAGIAQNDTVTLTWIGRTANSEVTLTLGPTTVGDPDFDVIPPFPIPNDHLKSISGGSAMASYNVQRAAGALHSKRTAITVTGLPVSLPKPTVDEANGTAVIDLRQLTGPIVHVATEPYPGKKAGDRISLIWTGTPQDGVPAHYTADHDVTTGEENLRYVFEVDRINLDPLLDGRLELRYQVIFAGTTSPQDSDTNAYTVVGATGVTEDFTGQLPRLIQQGGQIDTGKILITFESGQGDAGFPVDDNLPIDPGPLKLPMFHVCFQNSIIKRENQTLKVDLKVDCITLACDVHGLIGATTIRLLSSNNTVLATLTPAQTNYHLAYTSNTAPVRYVSIDAKGDWSRWDNFVMTS